MNKHNYTNHLIDETSPYLLEHAHNPVDWYPWGERALAKAKNENKPLIISIGYAACHWCHVMEHESFSDTAVAEIMNKFFVAIKIDREERPDLDQIYMNASMLISGRGGWPLNAFALPDGRPFYAGTYFPKIQWIELLHLISTSYSANYYDIEVQAEDLTKGLRSNEIIIPKIDILLNNADRICKEAIEKLLSITDLGKGGFNSSPKFPMPVAWEFLLQYYSLTQENDILKAVITTLDKMAMGGIYDQIGGGFSRYSTDSSWKVPHFEKMLYDNAQLVSLYAHAYQITQNKLYAEIVMETLNFIKDEMTSPEGGFYSSINADSEGEEGRFYTWTAGEINEILGDPIYAIIKEYYQLSIHGNWENNKTILFRISTKNDFAAKRGIKEDEFTKILQDSKRKLLEYRNKRIRPSLDDKILTAWNSLMLKAYTDAYKAFGKEEYLDAARKSGIFIEKNLLKEDRSLMRNYKDGKSNIFAFLDDYAFLIRAYIELYQVTFDIHWLTRAKELIDYTIQHFSGKKNKLFYYTSDLSESLITRTIEIPDNVIPSSNSVMAENLYLLGEYFDNTAYSELSSKLLETVMNEISTGGPYYGNWARLASRYIPGPIEIAIVGPNAVKLNRQVQQLFIPTAIFLGGNEENLPLLKSKKIQDQTKIYVCVNKSCNLPVESVPEAISLIRNYQNRK